MSLTMIAASGVYAAGKEIKLFTGTSDLAQYIFNWLIGIVPVSGAIGIAIQSSKANLSDGDPTVVANTNKMKKRILWWTVIGTTGAALISGVMAFYQ